MDIVQRINELLDYNHTHNQRNDVQKACSLLCEARDEIEHLRSLAGAVSNGPSFEDVKRIIAARDAMLTPTLKAFDGA